jgi:hypothetical protein
MSAEVVDAPANATPANNGTPPPASGVADHWAKSFFKPDFSLDHAALERLPDQHKGLKEVLSRQKTFDDVLTVMQHQQQLAGKKGLAPLPPDASETLRAERKAHMDQINGVPPSPKDYGLTKPEDLPEGAWHPKLVENAQAWAHKHSVSPAALKELVGMNLASAKEQLAGYADQERQFLAAQQQAFEGQIRLDNIPLERANSLVERGAKALGLDTEKPENQMLLKNASVRLMAMRHALATGEDTASEQGGATAATTDFETQANDIVHNPANPLYAQYWNRDGKFTRAQHESAVQKVNELYRQHTAKQGGGRR